MKKILILLIVVTNALAMEPSQETRGKKRFEPEIPEAVEQALQRAKIEQELFEPTEMEIEPIAPASSSPDIEMGEVPELIEETIPEWELPGLPPKYRKIPGGRYEKRPAIEVEPKKFVTPSFGLKLDPVFQSLPPEIKKITFDYLVTAEGLTNEAKLVNASENIRNFAKINKQLAQFLKQPNGIEAIITELANRFANGNKIEAATIFGTADAGKWLNKYFLAPENIYPKEQAILPILINAIKKNQKNVLAFLNTYVPYARYFLRLNYAVSLGIKYTPDLPRVIPHQGERLRFLQIASADLKKILFALSNARGAIKEARLSNASSTIAQLAATNEEFVQLLNGPHSQDVLTFLITELANNYTNGDQAKAAIFLGLALPTANVSQWLVRFIQDDPKNEKREDVIANFNRAIIKGDYNIVDFLLTNILFLNTEVFWDNQNIPLLLASQNNRTQIVNKLLAIPLFTDHINARDTTGKSALHQAAYEGSIDIVKKLLDTGANVNLGDEFGSTPLFSAIEGGHLDIVKLIIKAGANLNVQEQENLSTPLIFALFFNRQNIAKELIDAGANVNVATEDSMTVLMYAAQSNFFNIVKLLLDKGATINAQDVEGNTALHLAARSGSLESVKVLLDARADLSIRNHDGRTALTSAQNQNKEAIIKLLRDKGAIE